MVSRSHYFGTKIFGYRKKNNKQILNYTYSEGPGDDSMNISFPNAETSPYTHNGSPEASNTSS